MTKPVYKIEIWDSTPTLIHTIEHDAVEIRAKETVTENVGNFSFIVPTVKGLPDPYYYNDVSLGDKVKIWLGYDSISGDPFTVGKIYKISAPQQGYVRVFAGLNQGEILQRRMKYHKKWEAVDASVIVEELADDLGLGKTEIETDTTDVSITVGYAETYFNLLKKISDYWASAETQIKKDFYVDINNNLVWKSRPLRTEGVETLAVGDNILSYNVSRDLQSVKNKIKIYGDWLGGFPSDFDSRTEQNDSETVEDDGWVADSPAGLTIAWSSSYKIVGDESFSAYSPTSGSPIHARCHNSFSSLSCTEWNEARCKKLRFWVLSRHSGSGDPLFFRVRIYAPNNSHMFRKECVAPEHNVWKHYDLPLGETADWEVTAGSPIWSNVQGCEFYMEWPAGAASIFVDEFHFLRRTVGTAEDDTSPNYPADYTEIDPMLRTDSDCQKRAETLLYQLKNPPIRLDVVAVGNANLKIGDRLSMTIPAEGISNANYDVVSVEHNFSRATGFQTRAIMMNSAERRTVPPVTPTEILREQFNIQKQIAKGMLMIK